MTLRSWFFQKINKIDPPVGGLSQKTREQDSNIIRNETEVTANTTERQRVIRDYYEQLYAKN